MGEGAIALARSDRALAELVTQGTPRVWRRRPLPRGCGAAHVLIARSAALPFMPAEGGVLIRPRLSRRAASERRGDSSRGMAV